MKVTTAKTLLTLDIAPASIYKKLRFSFIDDPKRAEPIVGERKRCYSIELS